MGFDSHFVFLLLITSRFEGRFQSYTSERPVYPRRKTFVAKYVPANKVFYVQEQVQTPESCWHMLPIVTSVAKVYVSWSKVTQVQERFCMVLIYRVHDS